MTIIWIRFYLEITRINRIMCKEKKNNKIYRKIFIIIRDYGKYMGGVDYYD